ncbi:hypothetical protein [Stenotrophomonas maltophilia]|uniref:hypothetical protein n=1 Tax=Stenotrophomonas maltophilia TaxID=40324 RepID=UPI0013D94FE2|nr:hypothetical protein [Stenotrophomonas maltophilia]
MSIPTFSQYTTPELEVVARLDHALADEIFSLHRQGYDVREVLHEARQLKTEAQLMRREINRRKARP